MMNKKRLIIMLVSFLIIVTIVVTFILYKRQDETLIETKMLTFNQVYNISNIEYKNENGFNLNAEIKNISQEEQLLQCIKTEIINNEGEILFSKNENIDIYLNPKESYKYEILFDSYINTDNIKKVNYNYC